MKQMTDEKYGLHAGEGKRVPDEEKTVAEPEVMQVQAQSDVERKSDEL